MKGSLFISERINYLFGVMLISFFLFTEILPQTESNFADSRLNEKRIFEYLDVINSGRRDLVSNYVLEQYDSTFLQKFPVDYHVTLQMSFYYMSAGQGYDFIELRESGKNEIKALLKNKLTGAYIQLRIPVKEELPCRINNFIELKTITVPLNVQGSPKLNDTEMVERLKKCLDLLIKDDEFSGTVMFARKGTPLFKGAFGLANKSYDVPNLLDTKFNIGSVGKIFTGIAIAQLVQQNKLSFTDSIDKYLSADWLTPDIAKKIQVRHLLTHTSGLGDYFRKLNSQCEKFLFRDLDDYKILTRDETLSFEPGTRWSYSNTGMLLLGAIIEKVTGEEYFEYLRKNIFEPAKMKNTGANEKDHPAKNRSTGYLKMYEDGKVTWINNNISRVVKGSPSGGCTSTIEDLLNFDNALRSNKLLSPEYTELVLSTKPEINSSFYGYGFFIEQNKIGKIVRHSGDGTGINAQFSSYIDAGYTVIVLSNYSRPAAEIVDNVIYQMLTLE